MSNYRAATDGSHADAEKAAGLATQEASLSSEELSPEIAVRDIGKWSFWYKLAASGIELRGGQPVPVEERTDRRYLNIFTVFCTSMTSLLPVSTGIGTTLGYGIRLRDAVLINFFFSFLFCIPAAYMCTLGPRTGMRQMIQSRYVFGKWFNILPCAITMITCGGYMVISTVVSGQCLHDLSNGHMSTEGGIVLVVVICIFIAFFGYKILHLYERWAWIPTLIALIFTIGCAGSQLSKQAPVPETTGIQAMNLIALVAGNIVTFGNIISDYGVYMPPDAPKWRLAAYCWFGICAPIVCFMSFGAAIGGAIPNIPEWQTAYDNGSIGGVLGAILSRVGGFGKFIMVILSFSILGTSSRDLYTVSVDWHALIPGARKVPRAIFVLITAAIVIVVGIEAFRSFYAALFTFLDIMGYWAGAFTSIFLVEFLYFRKADVSTMDPTIWDNARELPRGYAAIASALIPWALVVPSMSETWYTGPIAKKTGNIAFELSMATGFLLYFPLRTLEIKWRGRY